MLLFLSPLLLVLLATQAFLLWTSDGWGIGHVLAAEQEAAEAGRDTLYKRLFLPDEPRRYKLENLLRRRPEIVALGSSTIMQLRGSLFSGHDFYNAGGLVRKAEHLPELAPVLEAVSPRLVIVGLDPWWFNDSWVPEPRPSIEELQGAPPLLLDWRARLLAYQMLAEHLRGSTSNIARALARVDDPTSVVAGEDALGLMARLGYGWRGSDGSYQYPFYLERLERGGSFEDRRNVPRQIAQGKGMFIGGEHVSGRHLAEVERFLRECREAGILVAGYSPVLSSATLAAFETSPRHSYFAEYRTRPGETFAAAGMPYVDATDAADRGLDDRYLIDGFHGAEVYLGHVLLELMQQPAFGAASLGLSMEHVERLLEHPDTSYGRLAGG